jgi:hypothetical protein
MIQANELRMGNYVKHPSYKDPIQINGVDKNDIFNMTTGEIPLHVINPIPLTEQWLIDFGFKYFADQQYEKQYDYLCFNWDKECGLIIFIDNSTDSFSQEHIKYVHQLQNLYFALTGIELIKQ